VKSHIPHLVDYQSMLGGSVVTCRFDVGATDAEAAAGSLAAPEGVESVEADVAIA